MANVRKDVIENKVYCEIIFRLGTHSYHANQFVEHFVEDYMDDLGKRPTPHKTQPVLARQMAFLHEEGWLDVITEEDGKKLQKNMKKYSVNFNKIIIEFLDYTIKYCQEYYERAQQSVKERDLDEKIKKLKNAAFRKKCLDNFFVHYFFRRLMEEGRHLNMPLRELTLKELYDLILTTGMYDYLEEDVEFEIGAQLSDDWSERTDEYHPIARGILRPPSKKIRKHIPKNRQEAWDFFAYEFLNAITVGHLSPLYYFMARQIPEHMATVLLDGVFEGNMDFYRLNHLSGAKEFVEKPPKKKE